MKDITYIGPCPFGEDAIQVTDDPIEYMPAMRAQVSRFRELIRRVFGSEPPGASLKIKSNPHDLGTYLELVCEFDPDDEDAAAYALAVAAEQPEHWE